MCQWHAVAHTAHSLPHGLVWLSPETAPVSVSGAQLFSWQICSEAERDSHRFIDTIDAAIEAGQVTRYPAYSKWAKAAAKQPRPKNPLASKKKRKQGTGDESALVAQIRRVPFTLSLYRTSMQSQSLQSHAQTLCRNQCGGVRWHAAGRRVIARPAAVTRQDSLLHLLPFPGTDACCAYRAGVAARAR